jgi:hypothetical protein
MSEADGCDGALWDVVVKEDKEEIVKELATTIYNFKDRDIKPGDLGFKYSILTIKNKDAEFIQAYIGDVTQYIQNQAKAGWSGLMVKNGVVPKKTIKEMFKVILNNSDFNNRYVRSILAQV